LATVDTTFPARLGGEEFSILSLVNLNNAIKIAERIRTIFENRIININGNTIRYTASFGVTQANKDDNKDTLIKRADKLLYDAKYSGRNMVKFG